ncbi:hypothetical protein ACFWY9_06145 [Amycolatopsis sp. NPDC059027]|uniref:hypothetical protein n=1 Tax=Amycolatopsis sp. NPDC059027 TaxID=3346709 RepID=UPI00366AFA04
MCLPELGFDAAPRLVFRHDAHRVVTGHGVYVLVRGGGIRLDGAEAGEWLAWLVPLLDGSRTFADLAAPLTPPRREYLAELVRTLVEAGAVQEISREPVCERIVSFLGYYLSTPARVPARYQDGPLTVAGGGPLCAAIVHAARRSGLRTVRPVGTADEAALAEALRGTEFVVHVPELPRLAEATRLERLCAEAGVPLVQLAVHRDEAWLTVPSSPAVSLAGAWRRHTAITGGVPDDPPGELDAATTAVLTSRAMLAVLRHRTGGGEPSPGLLRIRLDTLDETRHAVLAHPFTRPALAESADEFLARVARLASAEPPPEEEFTARIARLVDPRFGVLDELDGPRRTVLPRLARYGTSMVDPRRLLDHTGAPLLPADADPDTALRELRADDAYVWGHALKSGDAVLVRADRVFPALAAAPAPEAVGAAAGREWTSAVAEGLLAHCGPTASVSDVPFLVDALAARGYRPIVVPLDHDPAVHRLFPAVVRVLLDRRADG